MSRFGEPTRAERMMSLALFFVLVAAFLFLIAGIVAIGLADCVCGG